MQAIARAGRRISVMNAIRRCLPPVLCLGLAVVLGACSAVRQSAESLNSAGNRQYALGNYAGALESYLRAEVLRPDLPALNYNAANTLNQQKDYARAIDEGQKAVHSTDADVQDRAYYSIGNADVRTGQLREAVDAYKSALRVNPSDMDAKYNLEVVEKQLDLEAAASQQNQQANAGQAGQPGAAQQQGGAQPGQPGENGTPAEAQPGQAGQSPGAAQAQAGAAQPGQGGPGLGSSSSGAAGGYTGTPEGQAAALDPNLKRALDQFNQTGDVNDALRALDIAQQQQQMEQAAGNGNTSPPSNGRDW
jgi:Ca-activated chloride channel homolog